MSAGRDEPGLSTRGSRRSRRAFGLGLVAGAVSLGGFAFRHARNRRAAERARTHAEATLAERTRIARELHDTLLQSFAGITLQLEALRQNMGPSSGAAISALSSILDVADRALREGRAMVWAMRSPELEDHDLPEALAEAGKKALEGKSITLNCDVKGAHRTLPPMIETTILSIGREAVANAASHASATLVEVELAYHARSVHMSVKDDGRGAPAAQFDEAATSGHWGVAGMRERAARAGGVLEITSVPEGGTRVALTLATR